MRRRATAVLAFVMLLLPALARADDGGWWDWFWKMDPRFMGFSVDFHLVCLDERGRVVHGCEEWFRNMRHAFKPQDISHTFKVVKDPKATRPEYETLNTFNKIAHEIDFRVGYHASYGDRYDEAPIDPDAQRINLVKMLGLYRYHVKPWIAVEAGGGYLVFYGDGFSPFARGMLSVGPVINPISKWPAFQVLAAYNYSHKGITAADFGDNPARFSMNNVPEQNVSIAVGFDLRRIGNFR
jgi:hypothetical protein